MEKFLQFIKEVENILGEDFKNFLNENDNREIFNSWTEAERTDNDNLSEIYSQSLTDIIRDRIESNDETIINKWNELFSDSETDEIPETIYIYVSMAKIDDEFGVMSLDIQFELTYNSMVGELQVDEEEYEFNMIPLMLDKGSITKYTTYVHGDTGYVDFRNAFMAFDDLDDDEENEEEEYYN